MVELFCDRTTTLPRITQKARYIYSIKWYAIWHIWHIVDIYHIYIRVYVCMCVFIYLFVCLFIYLFSQREETTIIIQLSVLNLDDDQDGFAFLKNIIVPSWATGKPNTSWVILLWHSLLFRYHLFQEVFQLSVCPFLILCTAAIPVCLQLPRRAISSHKSMALQLLSSCPEISYPHLFIWITATYPLRSGVGFIPSKIVSRTFSNPI